MNEVLIFGTNEFAQRVNYYINIGDSVTPMEVKGFVLDDAYYKEPYLDGKEIFRYSEAKEKFVGKFSVIVCIGYSNMNENRKIIFNRLLADGWDISTYISSRAMLESNEMGIGNIFVRSSSLGFKSRIGNGNIFDGGNFSHHSVMGDFNFLGGGTLLGGNIKMGSCCFIGMNSTLKNSITIQDKTLIGAGCYMGKSTKKPGLCYAAPRALLVGDSEHAII